MLSMDHGIRQSFGLHKAFEHANQSFLKLELQLHSGKSGSCSRQRPSEVYLALHDMYTTVPIVGQLHLGVGELTAVADGTEVLVSQL